MLVVGETEKPGTDRYLGFQVEVVRHGGPDGLHQLVHRPTTTVNHLPPEIGRSSRQHHLLGQPVGRGKNRAQRLMAADHVRQRRTQRLHIQLPIDAQRRRHVVGRCLALELAQEPEPLLRIRQRHHLWPFNRNQRRQSCRALAETPSQLGYRRGVEQGAYRDGNTYSLVDGCGHPHRRQRIPTEVEERVVDPDPLQSEHMGVDAGQDLLDGRGGGAVALGVGVLGYRERPPVELAVDRQRQRLQHHDRRRHHIVGQSLRKLSPQLRRIGGAGDIGDQPPVARTVLAGDHDRQPHTVEIGERGLDFTEFDAVSADLHLLVGTAEVPQLPVTAPGHQIPGAIHACARSTERTRHKPGCAQSRPVHVTHADTAAGHVQLAHHSGRYRTQPLIQHEQRRPRYRCADRHHARTRPQRRADRGIHRRLGRTVGVDHHAVLSPPIHHLGRAGFTRHYQRRRLQALLRQHPCGRRSLAQHGDAFGDQQVIQFLRATCHRIGHHHQATTVQQRTEHVPYRNIEDQRVPLRPHRL